jgi:hypothetical protein
MLTFPAKGRSKEELLAKMRVARDHDVQWRQGRAFRLVYHISEEIDDPSTAITGTQPGGPVAAAWALMNYLGEEGYMNITEVVMKTTHKIQEASTRFRVSRCQATPR